MDEELIRTLVRESIARHAGATAAPADGAVRPLMILGHVSHNRYALPPSGGPCLIEPAVQCSHCGYCESHGH